MLCQRFKGLLQALRLGPADPVDVDGIIDDGQVPAPFTVPGASNTAGQLVCGRGKSGSILEILAVRPIAGGP